jgi:hypothetical protein
MELDGEADDLVDVHLDVLDLHVALVLGDLVGGSGEAPAKGNGNQVSLDEASKGEQ